MSDTSEDKKPALTINPDREYVISLGQACRIEYVKHDLEYFYTEIAFIRGGERIVRKIRCDDMIPTISHEKYLLNGLKTH